MHKQNEHIKEKTEESLFHKHTNMIWFLSLGCMKLLYPFSSVLLSAYVCVATLLTFIPQACGEIYLTSCVFVFSFHTMFLSFISSFVMRMYDFDSF